MKKKIEQFKRKSVALMIAWMVMTSLTAGCASHSKTSRTDTVQNPSGQTVVVQKEETTMTESHSGHGVVGSVFHLVGEILAFPFDVIAGFFRFIF